MNVNIDLFRSLAEQLAPQLSDPLTEIDDTAHSFQLGILGGYTVESMNGDFGEVFGLARACGESDCPKVSFEEWKEKIKSGATDYNKNVAQPSDEELNAIWQQMLEEIRAQKDTGDSE